MRVLDLFSGIGGFSLGLERAGMQTVAFCEIDPFCRRVLAKHWPGVPIFEDVRKLHGSDVGDVDVICGGFPCQDISVAGKGAGLAGKRSGLWSEYARLIGEIRPRFVIVENVAALLGRGLGDVLGTLAALGYDAEWHCIPASYVGAPHQRDRLWIVAYPGGEGYGANNGFSEDSDAQGGVQGEEEKREWVWSEFRGGGEAMADADGVWQSQPSWRELNLGRWFSNGSEKSWRQWCVEPDVGRVANGVPARVDRLKALGNAVVPQIPEMIGRAIMESMQ